MSLGFAGSARAGERRRRRLATDEWVAAKPKKRRHRIDAAHGDETPDEADLSGESPLHSILPKRRPILVGLTAVSFAALIGLVWLSIVGEHRPRWQQIVGFRSGHLLQTLGTMLLAGSVQWCGVIYWYRSRCRRDFAGDYRRWLLAGGTFALALPCWTANVHRAFGQLASESLTDIVARLGRLWPGLVNPEWNTPDLCWMVPFGAAAVLYGFGLVREMLPLRLRGTLLLCGLGWLAMAAVTLLKGPSVMAPEACELLSIVCTTTAFWCLFHCLWLHARHVVRVSNEPPRPGSVQTLALRDAIEGSLKTLERGQRAATSPYRLVRESVSAWQMTRQLRAEERTAEREARREAKATAKAAAIADREAYKEAKRQERAEAKQAAVEAKAERAAAKSAAKEQASVDRQAAKLAAAEAKAAAKIDGDSQDGDCEPAEETAEAAPQTSRSRRGRKRGRHIAMPEPVEEEPESDASDYDENSYDENSYDEAGYDEAESEETESENSEYAESETDEYDTSEHDTDERDADTQTEESEEDLSHLSRKERRRLRKQRRNAGR